MLLQDSFMLKNLKPAPNTLTSFSIFETYMYSYD